MIKMVDIKKISKHPLNPRKDFGDLSELADSIKQSGILQNLTIVPWFSVFTGVGADDPKQQEKMGYYALIGNRRLAAAKLAGLTEVPCAIADMDQRTQIATMLLENMQRNDLTVYEQAQGFQMMLNLGETIANISEKTGFSNTTVRRRMKLLELDQDKLKESAGRGAILADYVELDKIENIELRNSVLEKIGTSDFEWALKSAIDKEKKDKKFAEIIELLDTFATRVESHDGLKYVRVYYTYYNDEVEKPDDIGTVKYFYEANCHSGVGNPIYLYKENFEIEEDTDKKEKERIEREREEARKAEVKEISDRAYNLRADFIKSLSNTKAKKNIETIIEANIYANSEGYRRGLDYKNLAEIMEIEINDEDIEWKDIATHIWKQPELYLLLVTYHTLDDGEKYVDWLYRHRSNEDLDYIYKFLEKLGYEISEEELALRNGTHELFGE